MDGDWAADSSRMGNESIGGRGHGEDCACGIEEECSDQGVGSLQEEDSYIYGCSGDDECSWQSHVHEFLGSTELAKEGLAVHNHRFAGISGEAIYVPGSHVHRLAMHTDFFDHFHDVHVISGPATFLLDRDARKSDRKHVHFAEGTTSKADRHCHEFEFATLIESPLAGENKQDRD